MSQPAAETALVLSGGGAYGAFAVGIMKVLFAGRSPVTGYEPLQADIFAGTSVGAFNAALMAGHTGVSNLEAASWLEDIWLQRIAARHGSCGNGIFRIRGNPFDYADPACLRSPLSVAGQLGGDLVSAGGYWFSRAANFLASSTPLISRLPELINIGSFVDCTPYRELLHEVLGEQDVLQSPKRLQVIATNWTTGQPVHFGNSDFHDERGIKAVMASTAIPGVFPPVEIDDDMFVDGGVVENTPLSAAVDLGASEIHVIYLDPEPQLIPLRASPNSVDTLLRVYYLMLASKIKQDIRTAKWINEGIRAFQQFQRTGELANPAAAQFLRASSRLMNTVSRTYRILTVHRYYPQSMLGGDFGMVDYDLDPIARMINEGERVALTHDCIRSGCLL